MALRKKAIRETINADAEARHFYLNSEGKTCAIGGLARVAGVKDATLIAAEGGRIDYGSRSVRRAFGPRDGMADALTIIRRAISRRFGLTVKQQVDLQYRNDQYEDVGMRRAAIIAFVDSLR